MTQKATARDLVSQHGTTFAEEAGITLRDKPSPLFRLLVLSMLVSKPIGAEIAVAAARELSTSGWRTARAMAAATWQQRVDALGRAHYRRYDESTSRNLEACAQTAIDEYGGDLRRMHDRAEGDTGRLRDLLQEFTGIGPTGADVFCREAQQIWPELRPFCDERVLDGARRAGLPADPRRLARLVPDEQFARLAAALVRVTLGAALETHSR